MSHCASSIGPANPGRVGRERARVDHARPGHRVDAEPVPREVGERQPGHDLDLDARGAQQHDRALGNRRAARHRVHDLAVLVRRFDHTRRDRRVHGVEVVAAVVEQVERLERDAFASELIDRRMARRAHVAHRHPLERGARRGQQQVDAGRTEPDHDDPRTSHPPDGTVVVVVVVVAAWPLARTWSGCPAGLLTPNCEPCDVWISDQLPYLGFTRTFGPSTAWLNIADPTGRRLARSPGCRS